jgi:predicted secreted protein
MRQSMRLLWAGRTFAASALDRTGVFGRDWSHAKVVQAFRPHNVVCRKIPGPDGSEFMAPLLAEVEHQRQAVRPGGLRLGLRRHRL